ncbi:hypothetical protein D3C72_2007700 [compost metagenome]
MQHFRTAGILEGKASIGNRTQALGNGFRRLAVRTGARQFLRRDELHQQDDADDGDEEEASYGGKQLFRRFDR